jgi:hypothetical protein
MNYNIKTLKFQKFLVLLLGFFVFSTILIFLLLSSGKYSLVGKGFSYLGIHAFMEAKEISNEYAILNSTKKNEIYLTKLKKNPSLLSSYCGTFREGEILQNGILYKNKIYTIYTDLGEAGEGDLGYTNADILDLRTGESTLDKEISYLPNEFKNLSYNQVYGNDPLPKRLSRLDSTFFSKLEEPILVVAYGNGCETFLISILSIDLVLAISVLLRILLK